MPGERLSMRKIRQLLRLRWKQQLPQRVIANSLRLGQAVGQRLPQSGAPCGSDMAATGHAGRCRSRGTAVSAAAEYTVRSAPGPGLVRGASRSASAERDAGVAVGGIPSGNDRRVRLLVVLRFVSRVGRAAEADVAPGAYCRRAPVRRLRRPHHGGDRCGHRRDPACRNLRRRAGRLKLHLRRSHCEPGTGRLDWRPRQCADRTRRRAAADRQRRPQGRDHQGLLLRADGKPNLCRYGLALPHRNHPGTSIQTA